MPYPQSAKTEAAKPNFCEGNKKASTRAYSCGWRRVVLEITVLSTMFVLAATFALLPTAYSLWRHFQTP